MLRPAKSRLVMSALTGAMRFIIAATSHMTAVTGIMARPLTLVIARKFVLAVTLNLLVMVIVTAALATGHQSVILVIKRAMILAVFLASPGFAILIIVNLMIVIA